MGDAFIDIRGLNKLKQNLIEMEEQIAVFIESCAKDLTAILLDKVINRTPVGVYPEGSGKVGGNLRRNWTGGTEKNPYTYAQGLEITYTGDKYEIVIENPTDYASYVEFGHWNRNRSRWIEGRFMLTIAEHEVTNISRKVLEDKMELFLRGVFLE